MGGRVPIGPRRGDGPVLLLITLVAFAVTVIAVRVYLDWAGYPRIGGGGLHIAHMLWGGLLLVVAVLVSQLFVGRRSRWLTAIAAGVGVGLFIDEVGKFITESNDYFFAPAFPLIYASMLFLALLWLAVRRRGTPSAGDAIGAAASTLQDLADGRLSREERDRVVGLLRTASGDDDELAQRLADGLLSPGVEAQLHASSPIRPADALRWFRRTIPDRFERGVILTGLVLSSLSGMLGILIVLVILGGQLNEFEAAHIGPIEYPSEPTWVLLLSIIWVCVGIGSAAAFVLSLAGRHERAMSVARYSVAFALVGGGLLDTYVSQLHALGGILLLGALLLLILDQQQRLAAPVMVANA